MIMSELFKPLLLNLQKKLQCRVTMTMLTTVDLNNCVGEVQHDEQELRQTDNNHHDNNGQDDERLQQTRPPVQPGLYFRDEEEDDQEGVPGG